MMSVRKYEMPWRTSYEMYAAFAWSIGVVFFAVLAFRAGQALPVLAALGAVSVAMAVYRGKQALRILVVRASLGGRAMETLSAHKFRAHCKDSSQVFLGFGFEWHPVHSQRLYELSKIHFRDFVVSHWLLRALGYPVDPQPEAEVGLPYIHGVEPRERALHRPLLNFEGGTIIVGTTQSGKGVTLSVLASQAVYRRVTNELRPAGRAPWPSTQMRSGSPGTIGRWTTTSCSPCRPPVAARWSSSAYWSCAPNAPPAARGLPPPGGTRPEQK